MNINSQHICEGSLNTSVKCSDQHKCVRMYDQTEATVSSTHNQQSKKIRKCFHHFVQVTLGKGQPAALYEVQTHIVDWSCRLEVYFTIFFIFNVKTKKEKESVACLQSDTSRTIFSVMCGCCSLSGYWILETEINNMRMHISLHTF